MDIAEGQECCAGNDSVQTQNETCYSLGHGCNIVNNAVYTEPKPDNPASRGSAGGLARLSEILEHRKAEQCGFGNEFAVAAATEIAQTIPADALLGLTLVNAVDELRPPVPDMLGALNALEEMFSNLMYAPAPCGTAWIDCLDVCGAVRISEARRFGNMEEIYDRQFKDVFARGIKKGSAQHDIALKILADNGLTEAEILADSGNGDGRVKVNAFSSDCLDRLTLNNGNAPSAAQLKAIRGIFALYETDKAEEHRLKAVFWDAFDNHPHLKKLRGWWDSLLPLQPFHFDITRVGRVLARTNARVYDKKVPAIG